MKSKSVLFIVATLFAGIAVSYFFISSKSNTASGKDTANSKKNTTVTNNLILTPQKPIDVVVVDSATLKNDGFLVVREIEGNNLSQIVEMSKPLRAGKHNNIEIPLGSAEKGKELLVMIYEDYGTDGVFNDLDMPALDENGTMTASFVSSGKPLPASITEGESSDMGMMNMPGMKSMTKIKYTDKGFTPDKIDIESGSMVEFINESSTDMWVASMSHPSHTILPTFDQFRGYKKGARYRYMFDKKGVFPFHDHINPSRGGTINVR